MKVGLVPLKYDEYNYGGVLQFYALQQAIRNCNIDCEIVYVEAEDKICPVPLKIKIKSKIADMLYSSTNKKIRSQIDNVLKDRYVKIEHYKEKYYSKTVTYSPNTIKEYKALICGSDQIWNPNYARERAFLTFAPKGSNTIIYAASLGVEALNENQKKAFKPRVESLRHVSVQEHSAKKILDEFVDRDDIVVVLDPTLLLSKGDWLKLCNDSLVPSEKYIFTYFLGEYSAYKTYIEKFANDRGLKVVNIPFASGERLDLEEYGDYKIYDAAPDEFLALINNAEYVFTDSFHSCVFSTLFEKEFYVFERDGNRKMMGRIDTLLHNFELPNRIIPSAPINEMPRINYYKNETNQNVLKKISMDYLLESIND